MSGILTNVLVFITTVLLCRVESKSTQIPSHLLGCYRNNVSMQLRELQVPLSSQVLVELVRNVEHNLLTYLDMRTMASSMLHSLKFDGIQRAVNVRETETIIPVGPTSMHFNLYKLLNDYLLPGEAALFPMNTLSMNEMCTLHYILSSSVQSWERGDEVKSCPKDISIINRQYPRPVSVIRGQQKSSCPIERGVMRTYWGDVAPGRVLTGIVAALNMQDVKLATLLEALTVNEDVPIFNTTKKPRNIYGNINNVWAATTAGDLAEVTIYQGKFKDKLTIGPSGVWNDTVVPRNYYLPDSIGTNWEMTAAELIGGIDGALIATKMNEWTSKMSFLRMSQLLDMYYSGKGIAFDSEYRACKRREMFDKLLKNVNLLEQTANMAKLLTYSHIAYQIEDFFPQSDEQIDAIAKYVVESFKQQLDQLTDLNSNCDEGDRVTPMEILTVIDGTWINYNGRRLVAELTHTADVSYYGSQMGIISGSTGRWLTNVTNKIFDIFEDIHRGERDNPPFWPTSLSLTKGLETVTHYIQNKTDKECMNKLRSTRPTVVLVLANSAIPNDQDLVTAQRLISSIKAMQPGTAIIYAASESNSQTYKELAKNIYMNDFVVVTEKKVEAVMEGVLGALKKVPRQVMEVHCGISPLEYEDYIPFGEETVYEIPYHFLQTTKDLKVEFVGKDYGEVLICAFDKDVPENRLCKGVSTVDNSNGTNEIVEQATFGPLELCQHQYACIVQFTANMKTTKYKCAEDDCRFPDQARIGIRTSWISSSVSIRSNSVIIALTYLLVYVAF